MIRLRTFLPAVILSASALMMPSCNSQSSKSVEPQDSIEYVSRLESSPVMDTYINEENADLADKQAGETEDNKPNWVLITLAGLGLTGLLYWTHRSIMKNKGDKQWVDTFRGYCGDNENID